MYTLPLKTRIAIRRPSKQLLGLLAIPGMRWTHPAGKRIAIELTDYVPRDPWSYRQYHWYSFATGLYSQIHDAIRPFEIEPGYALVESASVGNAPNLVVFLTSFTAEPDALVALDVARDAILERRDTEAIRIVRAAIPHGYPLFLALILKEKNLLAQR